jgi:glycosidase
VNRLLSLAVSALLLSCATRGPSPAAPSAAARPAAPDRPWSDDVIYFVLVDRFANGDPTNDADVDPSAAGAFHGGDLDGLVAQLDEIASLGVTALWVNPLVRNIPGFVSGAGFPDWGYHGYWADDLTALDPRFGTEEDLRRLVDACHARGLKVLLDVVHNHAGYGTQYLRDPSRRTWLRTFDGTCGEDDLTQCLAGLPDWKTELPEAADWLMGVHIGWAKRSGVDGFRLDTVKHVAHEFWQEHARRVDTELGDRFFLLGEVWGGDRDVLAPYFDGNELDAGFDFSFQGNALAFVEGRGRTVAFDRYLATRHQVPEGRYLSHYLSSHDVPGALHQLGGRTDLLRLAVVLQLTARGVPMIYYGEEVGRPGGEWPQNRSDFPWGDRDVRPGKGLPRDESLRTHYRKLLALRHAHSALSRGAHQGLATDGDLYVFLRRDPASGDAVVVAVNRGAAEATVRVGAPEEWRGAPASDQLGASRSVVEAGVLTLTVPPREAAVVAPAAATAR